MTLSRRVAALEREASLAAGATCSCSPPVIYLEGQAGPRPASSCPRCGRPRNVIVVGMEGGGPVPGAERLPSRPLGGVAAV